MITQASTILYAISAYAHILPLNKEICFYKFAELIKGVYNVNEPHNKEVVSLLQSMPYNRVKRTLFNGVQVS